MTAEQIMDMGALGFAGGMLGIAILIAIAFLFDWLKKCLKVGSVAELVIESMPPLTDEVAKAISEIKAGDQIIFHKDGMEIVKK